MGVRRSTSRADSLKRSRCAHPGRSRKITPMARWIALLIALGTTGLLAQARHPVARPRNEDRDAAAPDRANDPRRQTRWLEPLLEAYVDADAGIYGKRLESTGISNSRTAIGAAKAALEHEGPLWIRQVAGETQAKRRLVVGAIALTAADFGGVHDWPSARALIEWACALVRKNGGRSGAERTFHWAAVSLLEAAADAAPLQAHVAHALQRFPGEPRFVLARGVATELRTWPDPRDGRIPRDRDPTLVGLAITRLSEARRLEGVGAEALMRLGVMAIRNGNPNEALPYLRDAEAAGPDPFVGYLIHLFRGRAYERLGRPADTIEAYRQAVAILPGQTAQLALATALAKAGDHAAAVTQAEAAARSTTEVKDPWMAYGRGDGRMWGDIAAQLRAQIRSMP
jgi:hypothetical protein